MEPRLVSRGNLGPVDERPARSRASMEPRLVSRGNYYDALDYRRAADASMEPRLVSRGNREDLRVPTTNAARLQWSRGS